MPPYIAAIFVLFLLGAPALGDVVILNQGDLPLRGKIVTEDGGYLRFQLEGLGAESRFLIDKARIKRFWRDEPDEPVDTTVRSPIRRAARDSAPRSRPRGAEEGPAPSRTNVEVRRDFLEKGIRRMGSLIFENPVLRLIDILAAFALTTFLLRLGSFVAELKGLNTGRAALLAVVTLFLLVLGGFTAPRTVRPETVPMLIAGETLAWILVARMLGNGTLSQAALLLSFFVSSVLLLAGTLFCVLSAL